MGYRLFKTTYRDRRGTLREVPTWYIEFRAPLHTIRRLPALTSRSASEEVGRNLVKLVDYHKATGGQTEPALARWLSTQPAKLLAKLVSLGLLASDRFSACKSLSDHLDDFAASLQAKGC